MASYSAEGLFTQRLPPNCTPTTPFLVDVSTYFESCIPTPLAFTTTLLGTLSIVSWLFAQMPQIYKNFQIKSTAGLSIFFLIEWLLGDTTNLFGAILTDQASWQIIIASYYVFVDLCLVIQYFWYTYATHRLYGGSIHSSGSSVRRDSDSINGLSPINTSFADDEEETLRDGDAGAPKSPKAKAVDAPTFSEVDYEKNKSTPPKAIRYPERFASSWMPSPSPRTLMYAAAVSTLPSRSGATPLPYNFLQDKGWSDTIGITDHIEILGTVLSWCSTVLYLGSRLPQLYKNWRRQSTAGLSPLLFLAAFCGNLFYSTSLLTNPNAWNDYGRYGGHGWVGEGGSQRAIWVPKAAPFFLGAAGVLIMDALMGVQFLLYDERQDKVVKIRDSQGHTRWERVNGWMRGWVPTIAGKERVVDMAESQRLLSGSRVSMSRRSHGEYDTF